jgi:hypothetical protein
MPISMLLRALKTHLDTLFNLRGWWPLFILPLGG